MSIAQNAGISLCCGCPAERSTIRTIQRRHVYGLADEILGDVEGTISRAGNRDGGRAKPRGEKIVTVRWIPQPLCECEVGQLSDAIGRPAIKIFGQLAIR